MLNLQKFDLKNWTMLIVLILLISLVLHRFNFMNSCKNSKSEKFFVNSLKKIYPVITPGGTNLSDGYNVVGAHENEQGLEDHTMENNFDMYQNYDLYKETHPYFADF